MKEFMKFKKLVLVMFLLFTFVNININAVDTVYDNTEYVKNADGKIIEEKYYLNGELVKLVKVANDIYSRKIVIYYENNIKTMEEVYEYNFNLAKEVIFTKTLFYDNGIAKEFITYGNDYNKVSGIEYYKSNGEMYKVINYDVYTGEIEDKINDITERVFDENGEYAGIINFEMYGANNTPILKMKITEKNGNYEYYNLYYTESGQLEREEYTINGIVIKEISYNTDNGMVTSILESEENGNIIYHKVFNESTGELKIYREYIDGRLNTVKNYLQSKISYIEYYSSGKLIKTDYYDATGQNIINTVYHK